MISRKMAIGVPNSNSSHLLLADRYAHAERFGPVCVGAAHAADRSLRTTRGDGRTAAFLLGRDATAITGQQIIIGGGASP